MRHQHHNHSGGYQSSGPLAPPTTLGPDGIPRPTRGPQAGPVLGFNIRACCYGFCQCIYDLIVFLFCCGLCFWCIHCCCHDNDEDYDGRSFNDRNTPYHAIPDPNIQNTNQNINQNQNNNPNNISNKNSNNSGTSQQSSNIIDNNSKKPNQQIDNSYQNMNNPNSNPNNNNNAAAGQDLLINTTNQMNPNNNNDASGTGVNPNDVTISYHDNYQSQASAASAAGAGTATNESSGNADTTTNTSQQPPSNQEETYMK